MSAGSQVYTVRISEPEYTRIASVIAHRNDHTSNAPWTFSDFIRRAVQEKLSHMERSRRTRVRKGKVDAQSITQTATGEPD